MKTGVDYYPEHWDKSLWEQDADLMKKSGVSLVRMAEFAWSKMEPEEGVYDFAWLDEAVKLFEDRNIEVILCTPTIALRFGCMKNIRKSCRQEETGKGRNPQYGGTGAIMRRRTADSLRSLSEKWESTIRIWPIWQPGR